MAWEGAEGWIARPPDRYRVNAPTTSNWIDIPGTGGHLTRLKESQDTIIEPLSNPRYPISEPPAKVGL